MAGRIGRVLSFIRSVRGGANIPQVKVEVSAGEIKDCDQYQDAGNDSPPLPEDYTVLVAGLRTGILNALGFVDTINPGLAEPGEKRIYSRDSGGGVVAEFWLQGDGTIVMENAEAKLMFSANGDISLENAIGTIEVLATGAINITNALGSFQMLPSGDIVANGAIIPVATGDVVTASGNSVDFGATEMDAGLANFTIDALGAIKGVNFGGVFELEAGGDFVANGATLTTGGDVVTDAGISLDDLAANVAALLVQYNLHTHISAAPGAPTSGTSNPAIPL